LAAAALFLPNQIRGSAYLSSWAIVLAWPLVAPILPLWVLGRWGHIIGLPLLVAIIVSVLSAIRLRSIGTFWPSICSTIFVLAFIAVAEAQLYILTSRAADRLLPECLVQRSFLHSLKISGADIQFDLHSTAIKNGKMYAWSYRLGDFYLVPDSVIKNVRPSCAGVRR
jgi:hypothetical protein